MTHHFDTKIAEIVGVNCAIIYENLKFWCLKNKANNKNFYDNNYWTYNSIKAWKELFPYMGEKQIRNALKKLEDAELIKSGEYNKNYYDRTRWYGIVELSERANGSIQKGETIPDNKLNKPAKQDLQGVFDNSEEMLSKENFNKLWKDYTLTFLKNKNRRGGTKSKALKKYLLLKSKYNYSSDFIYKYVEFNAGLDIGHKDLERLLDIDLIKQYEEDVLNV